MVLILTSQAAGRLIGHQPLLPVGKGVKTRWPTYLSYSGATFGQAQHDVFDAISGLWRSAQPFASATQTNGRRTRMAIPGSGAGVFPEQDRTQEPGITHVAGEYAKGVERMGKPPDSGQVEIAISRLVTDHCAIRCWTNERPCSLRPQRRRHHATGHRCRRTAG
ncbi:hypothetical protein D9M71_393660 [compost metagenome]